MAEVAREEALKEDSEVRVEEAAREERRDLEEVFQDVLSEHGEVYVVRVSLAKEGTMGEVIGVVAMGAKVATVGIKAARGEAEEMGEVERGEVLKVDSEVSEVMAKGVVRREGSLVREVALQVARKVDVKVVQVETTAES